MAGFNTTCFII